MPLPENEESTPGISTAASYPRLCPSASVRPSTDLYLLSCHYTCENELLLIRASSPSYRRAARSLLAAAAAADSCLKYLQKLGKKR